MGRAEGRKEEADGDGGASRWVGRRSVWGGRKKSRESEVFQDVRVGGILQFCSCEWSSGVAGREGEGGVCTSVHCRRLCSMEAALEESKSVCVMEKRWWGGWVEREREDKGDRSKTPQSGRQTFDRGALWFASFIFRTPPSSRIIMRQMHRTPAAWVAMGMGGQKHRERVQTCTSRLVRRGGVGGGRGNERWRGHLGLWEIPHSPEREASWPTDQSSGTAWWWY